MAYPLVKHDIYELKTFVDDMYDTKDTMHDWSHNLDDGEG